MRQAPADPSGDTAMDAVKEDDQPKSSFDWAEEKNEEIEGKGKHAARKERQRQKRAAVPPVAEVAAGPMTNGWHDLFCSLIRSYLFLC